MSYIIKSMWRQFFLLEIIICMVTTPLKKQALMYDRIQMPDLDLRKITINRERRWRGSAVKFTWQWMTDVPLRLMFCDISHLFVTYLTCLTTFWLVSFIHSLSLLHSSSSESSEPKNKVFNEFQTPFTPAILHRHNRVWKSRCARSVRLAWLSFQGKNKFLSNARRLVKMCNTCTVA